MMSLKTLSPTVIGRLPYLGFVGIVLLSDRFSKITIQQALELGEVRSVITGVFDLVRVHNTGIAFGILSGGESTVKFGFLAGCSIVPVLVLMVYSVRMPASDRILQLSLALILGGALGNLYDRLSYGHVIDFIYFHVGEYYWPAFNFADMAISIGVVCLVGLMIQDEIRARS